MKNLSRSVYYKKSGIYIIQNKKYFYVGSSNNLYVRINEHINNLKKGTHINKFLQNVYQKYGDLDVNVLEECGTDSLEQKELYYINKNENKKIKMNLQVPYRAFYKQHLSDDHRKKISESHKKNIKKNLPLLLKNLDIAKQKRLEKIQSGFIYRAWNKGIQTPQRVRFKQSISAKKRGCIRKYMSAEEIENWNKKISISKQGSKSHFAKLTEDTVIQIEV